MTPESSNSQVEVRPCRDVASWRRCVELQREIWRFDPAELVPVHVFAAVAKSGGQVLGAFDNTDAQVGFALAFPAFRNDRRYLHSHMVAVLPEYQDRGIGRKLKLAQRDEALERGIDLIEWTFDPLETRNAHFNIALLGAIVRHYIPDLYGASSSPLHRGLPTDRLLAEWRLNSPRVCGALRGDFANHSGRRVEIDVPSMAGEVTAEAQARIRDKFTSWFSRGYAVTGFVLNGHTGKYLLELYEG
jgi:predicted GNAT superfamily acetyltransferase